MRVSLLVLYRQSPLRRSLKIRCWQKGLMPLLVGLLDYRTRWLTSFLPTLLDALAEPKASAIENLDRAEKLGWLESTDDWLEMRKLRNQMVHEYIEDLVILSNALKVGHEFVVTLVNTAERFVVQAQRRIAISLS